MRRIGFSILCLSLALVGLGCSKSPTAVQVVVPSAVVLHQPPQSDIGKDYVLLTWSQSDAPDFTSYEVHQVADGATAETSDSTLKAIVGGRANTAYRVLGLADLTEYVFVVRTVTASGGAAKSNAVRVKTADQVEAPPDSVTLLAPVDSSYDRAIIKWTSNRQRTFDRYVIYTDTVAGFDPSPANTFGTRVNSTDTLTLVTGLTPSSVGHNVINYFRVGVFNFANKRSLSNEISLRSLLKGDTIPPPAPVVSVGRVTNSSITLNWNPCPDGIADWAAYQVLSDTVVGLSPKDATKLRADIRERHQATVTIDGLSPDKTYYFLVVSRDVYNNFSTSDYEVVRTRPPVDPQFKFGGFGPAAGKFQSASAVAIDAAGRAIIANTGNNRLDVFASPLTGDTSLVASIRNAAPGDPLSLPEGVAVDAASNIYVGDTGNNRIVVLGSDGTLLREFGLLGSDSAGFNAPTALAVDGEGNLWVCDRGNDRVKKMDPEGHTLLMLPHGATQAVLSRPSGICFEPTTNEIYVSDQEHHRVVRYSLDGGQTGIIGSGPGSATDQFTRPVGVSTDGRGHVFIADTGNDRFKVYHARGATPILVFGTFGLTGGDADLRSGQIQLRKPRALAATANSALILDTDNTRAIVASLTLDALQVERGRVRAAAQHTAVRPGRR
jgi:sugar lactone lactonase YvrE